MFPVFSLLFYLHQRYIPFSRELTFIHYCMYLRQLTVRFDVQPIILILPSVNQVPHSTKHSVYHIRVELLSLLGYVVVRLEVFLKHEALLLS